MLNPTQIHNYKRIIHRNKQFISNSALIKYLSDPTCFQIMYVLAQDEYVCPSEFSEILGLSLSTISHQLAKLRQAGLVKTVRHGKIICYFLANVPKAKIMRELVHSLIPHHK